MDWSDPCGRVTADLYPVPYVKSVNRVSLIATLRYHGKVRMHTVCDWRAGCSWMIDHHWERVIILGKYYWNDRCNLYCEQKKALFRTKKETKEWVQNQSKHRRDNKPRPLRQAERGKGSKDLHDRSWIWFWKRQVFILQLWWKILCSLLLTYSVVARYRKRTFLWCAFKSTHIFRPTESSALL